MSNQIERMKDLSRRYGVTTAEIAEWKSLFPENGLQVFKRHPEASKPSKAERKITQLEMELELVKQRNEIVKRLREQSSGS